MVIEHWLLALMMVLLPPSYVARGRHVAEAEIWEDYIDTTRNLSVVLQEEEPLFDGPFGRAKTATVLLALAKWETGFRNELSGDGGRSHCMLGIMTGIQGRIREGSGQELREDKQRCFRAGLRIARNSLRRCRGLMRFRLAAYASGSCSRGLEASSQRMRDAMRFWQMPLMANSFFEETDRLAEME